MRLAELWTGHPVRLCAQLLPFVFYDSNLPPDFLRPVSAV